MNRAVIFTVFLGLIIGCAGDDVPGASSPANDAAVSAAGADGGLDAQANQELPGAADAADTPELDPDAAQEGSQPGGVTIAGTGWIGGACTGEADCAALGYTETAVCETEGFFAGMCTQRCTDGGSFCPDSPDLGAISGISVTRCISDAAGQPRCVAECDFSDGDSGCRGGYVCVNRLRHGDPDRAFPVCLPEVAKGWPGATPPADDIGAACDTASDCENAACLPFGGGYCSRVYCDQTGCPQSGRCVSFESDSVTACLRRCDDTDCRQDSGFGCDPDFHVCIPTVSSSPWDPTVGAADCEQAFSDGLHRCDATPDNYVVINKSARNVALCDSGEVLANFNVGLGFAPLGDKQREGDGKTPEGVFYIPRRLPNSQYYRAFLLSYPDAGDSSRGYSTGLIDADERNRIDAAQSACVEPPQHTGLGGLIEIHGFGGGADWTWGCAALGNDEIDQIWALVDVGDTVVVLP